MTTDVTVDVHLGPDDMRAALRARRARRADRRRRRRCRRSGSTTSAAASCSTRSRGSPEYYPTRARAGDPRSADAADDRRASPAPTRSSSSARARRRRRGCCSTRCADAGTLTRFVPFDVSEPTLRDAAAALAARLPGRARCTRSSATSSATSASSRAAGRRIVAFLGGTIGNLAPGRARQVPRRARGQARARRLRCCSAPTW